jgi:hypothetical protein
VLGVKNYTQDYVDECRKRVYEQLATYKDLITAARNAAGKNGTAPGSAIEAFEPVFFNNMAICVNKRGIFSVAVCLLFQ